MAETEAPKRFRLTIPAADGSVLKWMGAQQNVSYSIRQLIRDAIRRDGYVDVTCSEVQQLPRRGRPPKEDEEGSMTESEYIVTEARQTSPRHESPVEKMPTDDRDEDGFVDPSKFFG